MSKLTIHIVQGEAWDLEVPNPPDDLVSRLIAGDWVEVEGKYGHRILVNPARVAGITRQPND